MLLSLFVALAQQPLRPADEVELREIACVPLQAPQREEGSISKGAEPDPDSLSFLTSASIHPGGRVLACDSRDSAVHVFDEQGERVTLCVPPVLESNYSPRLWIDRDRRIHVGHRTDSDPPEPFEYLFDADGTYLEDRPLACSGGVVLTPWWIVPSPREDACWEKRHDADEWVLVSEGVERERWHLRPDLAPWRSGGAGYLADGRFAVFDSYFRASGGCGMSRPRPPRYPPDMLQYLFLFDRAGRYVSKIVLPESPRLFGPRTGAEWALFLTTEDEAWLLQLESETFQRATLPVRSDTREKERREWGLVVHPELGEELWVVETRARRLLRYALPE